MLRKSVLRFLAVIAMSWLFPHAAAALDFSNGFPVGDWGNGIRPCVRVSAQDGRLSAIFSVVITNPGSVLGNSGGYRPADSQDDGRGTADRKNTTLDFGP